MKDINGEKFQKVDLLKVIKLWGGQEKFSVGDVVKCIRTDESQIWGFKRVSDGEEYWYPNNRLQKL